jgi:CRISPR-associated endonuclease/helicase Cas3
MTKKRSYGRSRGVELTDDVIEKAAKEAEAGYDLRRLTPRRGRPPMGSEAATVFQVRLEPELREALARSADEEATSPSELVRRILRSHLGVDSRAQRRPSTSGMARARKLTKKRGRAGL